MLFQSIAVLATAALSFRISAASLGVSNEFTPTRAKREIPSTHGLHELQDNHWLARWTKRSKVPEGSLLPMRIGLVQQNLEAGALRLSEISNPNSPEYGRHMSTEEVMEMFSPSDETIEAVKEWLFGAGFAPADISLSTNRQWIQFDAHAGVMEDILFTEYFEYEHFSSGSRSIAVEEYHLPQALRKHVDYITPGVRLRADPGKLRKMKRHQDNDAVKRKRMVPTMVDAQLHADAQVTFDKPPPLNSSACDVYVTASCIRAQYTIPNNTLASPGNELGLFEGLNDHYSKECLDTFFSALHPEIPNGTYPEERLIDGAIGAVEDIPGFNVSDDGGESDLDFEAAWPLIWPQKMVLFQTDDQYYEVNQSSAGSPYYGYWNTFFDAIDGSYCTYSAYNETGDCTDPDCLDPVYPNPNPGGYKGGLQCGVYKPTNVISISYSGGESDLPASYLKRQCNEIMKLSLQGVTVVESSGDYGVASYPGDFGLESGCAGPQGEVFYPSADVTCPYVLAVGSTKFNHINGSNDSTVYWESSTGYSGGGFSNYFDAPDWQRDAISDYFDEVSLNFTGYDNPGTNFSYVGNGVYRIGGRGYPDVSAIGVRYMSFTEGRWAREGGTSLSAPIWAAVITLVNERRLAANKSTVGFIHPVLYAHLEIFNDITEGSNPGCNSSGFLAAKGWDPLSGLGTPNFPKLVELFLSL